MTGLADRSPWERLAEASEPYTGKSYRHVPAFVLLFTLTYFGGFTLFSAFDLKFKDRALLSSSTMSILHGVPASVLSFLLLWNEYPTIHVDGANVSEQTVLLEFCLAYMITDTFLYLLPFTPGDYLFMGHHIMVTGWILSCLTLGRGAMSCVFLLWLGEATSIWQNSWYMCKMLRKQSKVADACFGPVSVVYTFMFLLVRSIVGPPAVAWLCYEILSSKTLPPAYRYTWGFVAALTLSGSQIWSYKLWQGFKKNFLTKKTLEKQA
jgi:hypothetical protein